MGFLRKSLSFQWLPGTFLISHVNDPFFWIFGELAELGPSKVFGSNTFGSALMGIVSFLLISAVYIFFY
ncbi:putative permease [Methanosarcina barkeri 227]|uniref:Putative permease n=2 Tax=Methanosarcina barkeri TaxID=2208 RepID=A0A0E3QZW3_METBA|nr:putative permease [Methanosarcina barkeri MS]AKB59970.1 putative permease [Methanosarcina barkeri 227]